MEIKRYLIDILFQRDMTVEAGGHSLYLEEYMPERLGRMLEKLLHEEHEDMHLNFGLNEWEFFPIKSFVTIAVSASSTGRRKGQEIHTAIYHVNMSNGMVALQGVQ